MQPTEDGLSRENEREREADVAGRTDGARKTDGAGRTDGPGTPDGAPAGVARRGFLRGAALAGAGLAAGGGAGVAVAGAAAAAGDSTGSGSSGALALPPFHGRHQLSVTAATRRTSAMVSFDVTAGNRAELADLLRTVTERARFLTSGGRPQPLGITGPPADSGILGGQLPSGTLSVTLGAGASLFDDRFGLAARRPRRLTAMPSFPDDDLRTEWCHGDLSLQLHADDTDTVLHALRDIARHTRGGMQVRWRIDGFGNPPRPSGTPRNLLGFRDGIANPDDADNRLMNKVVWVGKNRSEPDWATDGSYLVVRLIRMLVEFWDRVSVGEQERIFGRAKDSGAPLDGNAEQDVPHYADDPKGDVIPLDSHMRLANPRTAGTADQLILRRPYNYDLGMDSNGNLDMGLVFCCYQQDIARQFEAVQRRLEGEPLTDYIVPFGGGYFFALPGVRDVSDWYGRALLA